MTEKRYTITLGKNNEFKEIIDHCRQDKHISVIQFLKQVGEQDKAFKKLKQETRELKEENEQSKMMIATLRNIVLENENLEQKNKELKEKLEDSEFAHRTEMAHHRVAEKELQERNDRQYKQLGDLYRLIEEKDWRALTDIMDDFKKNEKQLQKEWKCYE